MTTQVLMPQLGESVVEGTVAKWLVAEGAPVTKDEPLLAITTDKVDTEIPAPASGILLKIHVPEGQTVAKGTVLAEIGEQETGGREQELGGREQGSETHSDSNLQSPISNIGFISPAIGRLAAELGVDLTQVIGTGAGGRITKKDVLAYIAAPVPREPATGGALPGQEAPTWAQPATSAIFEPLEEVEETLRVSPVPPSPAGSVLAPLSSLRRAIATHMLESVQTAPHVTTVMEADMTRVIQARERLRGEFERQGVKLTFTPFFVQAIVAGLKTVPEANSSFRDDALLIHRRIHVGMAVAIPDGLIVPVIRDAGEKSLLGLARAVSDLAERARSKQLKPDDVQGGTFTLTNHGTSGSLFATPIIVQPQAGTLGVGVIQKRPVVITGGHPLLPDAEDVFAIRPMAYLSFTFDHRVLDGQGADGFLGAVKKFLEGYVG
ncbi:MAG: dihydrolipoamide acetyltransferase family protein [Chloroflexi bacterium]|nr:dihydrolipoamide acetyltransferase family protein [Chloroflexota bacterium]